MFDMCIAHVKHRVVIFYHFLIIIQCIVENAHNNRNAVILVEYKPIETALLWNNSCKLHLPIFLTGTCVCFRAWIISLSRVECLYVCVYWTGWLCSVKSDVVVSFWVLLANWIIFIFELNYEIPTQHRENRNSNASSNCILTQILLHDVLWSRTFF